MMITTMQQMADDIIRGRAGSLMKRIKIETHWNLLTAPARSFDIDESSYTADRAAIVKIWPDIRHQRVKASAMLYDVVADQASLLAHLIEIRRQRTFNRSQRQ